MISVESRDGRKSLGLGFGSSGREMEETELEEGEAYDYDDDANIDPDVDLSYLDEKVQVVLGHFQKDFEGGVSAENLGAKFGGYGSFLPSYQRSPSIWSQPRTPQKVQNYGTPRSPNLPVEGDSQYSALASGATTVVKQAASRTDAPPPISRAPFAESSSVKEPNLSSLRSMSEYNSHSESLSKVNKAKDQKTLKVRLKVGSDNMAQKAAAIFNDLGFPPSSPEDSPVESGGFSPEYRESPDQSPTSILQIMTSSPVPDGLLSPLADSLLHLTKKEKLLRDNRPGLVSRDSQGNSSTLMDESSIKLEEGKGFGGKKMKPVENNSWSIGIKHGMVKDVWGEYNALPNKETDVETPEGRELIADSTKFPVPSNSKLMVVETAKGTSRASEVSSETKKFKVKDRYISSDFVKDDSESITSLDVKKTEKLKLRTSSGDKVPEERKESRETAKSTSRASEVSSETKKFKVKDRYISSDFVKDDSESITSLDVKKAEKLKLRTSSGDKVSEDRKENPQKDVQPMPKKDGKNKGNRGYDSRTADFDGSKGRKELNIGSIDPPENKVILKMSSFDRDAGKLPYVTEQTSSGGKKKPRGSKNNGNPAVELSQESLRVVSSAAPKEKRKSSGDSSSRIKVDDGKSRRDFGKKRDTYKDIFGDEEMEPAENSANSLEKPFGDRRKDYKLEFSEKETRQIADKTKERLSEKEIHQFADKSRERQNGKLIENPLTVGAYQKTVGVVPPTGNGVASEAVSASVAPMAPLELINEDWVACDKCQQWRLLPFGVNPDNLPKKWVCSMSYWLPGMNHCNISEDDTTKALRSLMYQVPAPESNLHNQPNGAASGVTLSQVQHLDSKHQEHSLLGVPSGGRKKLGMKETTDSDTLMGPMHTSTSLSKSQQVSLKSRSLTDVNQSPLDHNVGNKAVVPHLSKSSDSAARKHRHKQKDKHKLAPDGVVAGETNQSKTKSKREDDQDGSRSSKKIKTEGLFSAKEEWSSDHGGIMGETNHSKIKSKKEADQDGSRSSKKIKSEGLFSAKEEWNSDHGGITGNSGPTSINCSFAKEAARGMKKHGEYSSSKESRFDVKDNVTSVKKPKELVQVSIDAVKFDSRDIAAKKRKVKEWQESQAYPLEPLTDSGHHMEATKVSLEGTSESELKRGKKAKTSRSEGKESHISTADARTDKRDRTSLIFSSSSRDVVAPEIEDGKGYVGRDKQQAEYRGGNMASQPTLDTVDPLRRDLGYGLPSLAATSSSSKVSGSRKSKGNFQEAKGSPVESVSSSPLRIPDKGTSARRIPVGKEDATNVGTSIIGGSLRRCSDGEGDGRDVRSGSEKRETDHSVFHRGSLESSVLDYQDREVTRAAGSKSKAPTQSFSLEKENPHVVNGGVNTVDQSIQHVTFPSKEHGYDDDHVNKHHGSNGSLSRKSGKSSSLRSKDKQKGSKSDGSKGKLKVSDSSNNQEGVYPTKHSRNNGDIESQDLLYHDEESRGGKYRSQEKHDVKGGKDEKSYSGKKEYLGKWSNEGRRDNHSKYGANVGIDVKSSATCSKDGKFNSHQNSMQDGVGERSSYKSHSDRPDHEQLEKPLRGTSHSFPHSGDKQESQTRCPRPVPNNHKGSGTDSLRMDASNGIGDDLKATKQPRKPDNQAGPVHNSLRHSTPGRIAAGDVDGPSPVRKDSSSQAANAALKEARDLKHSADRLKNSGSGLESTGLYFEAVLKFLHGASLLEPGNAESSRHGESQSVHVYSTTASLCEFVAQEYERCKEMAFAALAYKCLEVACMRVVYFKHWSINKDRHELQSALHVGPPGESPSSSASDVDNLNNQGTVDKLALAKGVGSPHVAGNHVIAARSRPNFVRVLNFTQDVNSAMEASRKSQNAFAAASASLEESQYEGICCVKRALDFNFHDVQGLLRLVRLAMEAISR